ncbi:hypothetical protein HG434_002445 [Candidatus Saccharibacteria bacterium]|nr:hypothetical protein [Candidatus Saccharibacteria bacterium]
MPENKDVAIRKRQQIDSSKKTMFLFVAGAAFVSGVAIVVSFFLVRQILFHGAVVLAKQDTINTLENNKKAAESLKDNVRSLEANEALNSVKLTDSSSPLQTILDALPASANADALGASIQKKFVNGIAGLSLESISVHYYTANESGAEQEDAGDGRSAVSFTMTVSGTSSSLKELLTRFEKSIRVINITEIEMQASEDGKMTMDISGKAYFEPAQKVGLGKKVIKP